MFIFTILLLVNIIILCYSCMMRYHNYMQELYYDYNGLDINMFDRTEHYSGHIQPNNNMLDNKSDNMLDNKSDNESTQMKDKLD